MNNVRLKKHNKRADFKDFFLVSTIILVVIAVSLIPAATSSSYRSEGGLVDPESETIFIAPLFNQDHTIEKKEILKRLDIYGPGTVLYGYKREPISEMTDLELTGFQDTAESYFDRDRVRYINLDSYLDSTACEVDDSISAALSNAQNDLTVIVSRYALWDDKTNGSGCEMSFWTEKVLPLVDGKFDVIVGGYDEERVLSQVDYVQDSTYLAVGADRFAPGEVPLQIFRVRYDTDGHTLAPFSMLGGNSSEALPTYNVEVSADELKTLYQSAPFYPTGLGWQQMIEPESRKALIQTPLASNSILYDDQLLGTGTMAIRGNVGNHWTGYKKSWDIVLDETDRQIKLVLPSDRGYANQMFAQYVSEELGVPTPRIHLRRLVINGLDHGVYLEYEDLDKVFLEERGFNSDVPITKNYFRDHINNYKVDQRLSNTTGNKEDKSMQFALSSGELNADNFEDFFDVDSYARWLAVQIILGDKHQNLSDNFRYFQDRPTGRQIMVTWDASVRVFDPNNPFTSTSLTGLFYEKNSNKILVKKYVSDFISDSDIHTQALTELLEQTTPIFSSDSVSPANKRAIENSQETLMNTFAGNLSSLESWVK